MKEWNRIDLHQHTLNEITVDRTRPNSDYTHEKFEELIIAQKVDLKAVTNHNTLNINDHIKHALICNKNNVEYIPGVEIDYNFEGDSFHAISLLNPKMDIIPFSRRLKLIVDKCIEDNKRIQLDRDGFAAIHNKIEFIFIPHIMKKNGVYPSAKGRRLTNAESWIFEVIQNGSFVPVIFENTKDYHRYTIYGIIKDMISSKNVTVACYTGSDYKFDKDIERANTANNRIKYCIHAEPTYRGLEVSIRNHETRLCLEDQIIKKANFITSVDIKKTNKNFSVSNKLTLSEGLNVIIGSSGTGKTLLLNEIFRKITGNNLQDVTKVSNSKSAYVNKTLDEDFINIETYSNDYKSLRVIEIPNIYTEIVKYMSNSEKLAEVFGISDRVQVNQIINDFISKCIKFENNYSKIKQKEDNIVKLIDRIKSDQEFINLNEMKTYQYNLSRVINSTEFIDKIRKKIEYNKGLIANETAVRKYFVQVGTSLEGQHDIEVNQILDLYKQLIKKLEEKNVFLYKQEVKTEIDYIIRDKVNKSIQSRILKLGEKEKNYKVRMEIFNKNRIELIKNIKEVIVLEKLNSDIELIYPFNDIKRAIQENSNEMVRFTLGYTEEDIEKVDIRTDTILNVKNNLTKLRKVIKKDINFFDSNEVKGFLIELHNEKISASAIMQNDLPLELEMNVEDDKWTNVKSINQGTIAKKSMEFYFKNKIMNENPDVIFIDQPENDVDKEFLTNVLSSFIKTQKIKSQIIITSHDAILTVNSDVNRIIQADLNNKNQICYQSYPIEFTEGITLGTDNVANILDGGKDNIVKRYQIYGGVLRYED